MRRNSALLLIVICLVFLPSISQALPNYLTRFELLYPKAISLNCAACHLGEATGGPRNAYGSAWAVNPHATTAQQDAAFALIEKDDSDGDGFTNLTEITANTATAKVLPGFAALPAQLPAAAGWLAAPPRLLFVDNFKNANGGSIPDWTVTGAWSANRVVLISPAAGAAFANPTPPRTPAALTAFRAGSISARIQIVSGSSANIIFSQSTATAFRFVRFSPTAITIGQTGTVGGVAAASVTPTTIPFTGFAGGVGHNVRIAQTAAGAVSVFVDNVLRGTHKFTTAVPGKTGLMTRATRVRFDNAVFSK